MAFNKLPVIDNYSKNDDEAKIALAQILNQRSGFVLREVIPDKGTDYKVELIEDGKAASNWHFDIQLKSVERPTFIKSNSLISYSFETSRLHYLLRTAPICGIIVLYDVSSKKLYYELVDELYKFILEENNGDSWQQQETIQLHIPVGNGLTEDSAKLIYEIFLTRHKNAIQMQSSQGAKYNLPAIALPGLETIDINNSDQLKAFIKHVPITALLLYDLNLLYDIIVKIPQAEIVADKALLTLACFIYSESGKIIDSTFLAERLTNRFTLEADEVDMIDFLKLKNSHVLGKLSTDEFIQSAKLLLQNNAHKENTIILRLNILYMEFSKAKKPLNSILEKGNEIGELYKTINQLKETKQKYLYKIWLTEIFAFWANQLSSKKFTEFRLREHTIPLSLEERLKSAKETADLHSIFYQMVKEVDDHAKQTKDDLLQAYAIAALIRFTLYFEYQHLFDEAPGENIENQKSRLRHKFGLIGVAYNVFMNQNLFRDAFNMLGAQLEIAYILNYKYNDTEDYKVGDLESIIQNLAKELELSPYEVQAKKMVEKDRERDREPPMYFTKNLTDAELEHYAQEISVGFPNGKKDLILRELSAYRSFYERCQNSSIELMVVQQEDKQKSYTEETPFMLHNKLLNIRSLQEYDIDRLLKSWGY